MNDLVRVFVICAVAAAASGMAFADDTRMGSWGLDIPITDGNNDEERICLMNGISSNLMLFYRSVIEQEKESELFMKSSSDGHAWPPGVLIPSGSSKSDRIESRAYLGANGRLHHVYTDNSPGDYEIFDHYSDDDGATWSSPLQLSPSPSISWNVSVTGSGDNVYIVWDDNRYGSIWSYNPAVYFRSSYDNGETWNDEVRVSSTDTTTAWYSRMLTDESGTIHVVWHDSRRGAKEIYYTFSTDRGETWAEEVSVTKDDDIPSGLFTLVQGPEGHVHLFWIDPMETNDPKRDNPGIYYCRSIDDVSDGISEWSNPVRLADFFPTLASSNNKGRVDKKGVRYYYGNPAVLFRDGILHLIWTSYLAVETPGGSDYDSWIYWMYSRDEGDTWSFVDCISNVNSNSKAIVSVVYRDQIALGWIDNRRGNDNVFVKYLRDVKDWAETGGSSGNTNYFPKPSEETKTGAFVKGAVAPSAESVLTADLDNDGLVELVALNPPNVSAYDDKGQLKWQANAINDANISSASAALNNVFTIADVNGGGKREVIVSVCSDPQGVTDDESVLLIYNSDGSLLRRILTPTCIRALPMRSADLDDDGKAEIICSFEASQSNSGLIVYNGDDGSLYGSYEAGDVLYPYVVSDINNDGNDEIVCSNPARGLGGAKINGIDDQHAYVVALKDSLEQLWLKQVGYKGGVCLADRPSEFEETRVITVGTTTNAPNSPYQLASRKGSNGQILNSKILNADLGLPNMISAPQIGDDEFELTFSSNDGGSYIFDYDMNQLASCASAGRVHSASDINGDGKVEILTADGNTLKVMKEDFQPVWQAQLGANIEDILVSDLGDDGNNEIVVKTEDDVEILWYPPLVQFSEGIPSPIRREGQDIEVFLPIELSKPSGVPVTVGYTLGGTASQDDDYIIEPAEIVFDPGEMNKEIRIQITDDDVDEYDETLEITLANPVNAVLGSPIGYQMTIEDNDPPPSIQFAQSSSSVGEDTPGGVTYLQVNLTPISGKTATISYAPTAGTASPGVDYSLASNQLSFQAGDASKYIPVQIINDNTDEPNETVEITLANPAEATLGQPTTHILTIIDDGDPPPSVDFVPSSHTESEDIFGAKSIAVQLSDTSGWDVTVPFTMSGTATLGDDYEITSSPVVIPADETAADIAIAVAPDAKYESDETVIVTMDNPAHAVMGEAAVYTATIINDDGPPTVYFSSASQSEREDVGAMTITIQLSAVSDLDVAVPFAVTGGTTAPGDDYTITPSPITIPAGDREADITIAVVNDSADELDETIIVTMGEPINADKGATVVHTATIIDDDWPTVGFDATSSNGAESVTTLDLSVSLSRPSTKIVTVGYAVTGGAATPDVDYMLPDGVLSFNPGETVKNVQVAVINDALYELDETIEVTLNTTNAIWRANRAHTYTIENDDPLPTVELAAASQSAPEDAFGTRTITAQLSAVSGLDVTIPFTLSGTGNSQDDCDGDYTVTPSLLIIPAGAPAADIAITVKSDTRYELDETIVVTMGEPTNAVKGAITEHTATIQNDDPKPAVTFAAESQRGKENIGEMTIIVQISAASGLDVTVPFTLDGTASSPDDYTITPSPVTIPACEQTATITITIVNDSIDEPEEETLIVKMGDPVNADKGTIVEHTATIEDDDFPTVAFDAASSTGAESTAAVNLAVSLNAPSPKTVTVDYSPTGGAATRDVDYTLPDGTLTFNPNETTKNIQLAIIDDAQPEGEETIIVTLSAPSNANLGTNTIHTYTIIDFPDIEITPLSPIDFREALVSSTVRKIFEIGNVGEVPLNVTNVEVTQGASDFSIISPQFPQTVEPGARAEVVVEFKPALVGEKSGAIQIRSYDPDEGLVELELNGVGSDQEEGAVELLLGGDVVGFEGRESQINLDVKEVAGDPPSELQLFVGFDPQSLEYREVRSKSGDSIVTRPLGNELMLEISAANGRIAKGPLADIIFEVKQIEDGAKWKDVSLPCTGSASSPAGPVAVQVQEGAIHIGPGIVEDFLVVKSLSLAYGNPGKLSLQGFFNTTNSAFDLTDPLTLTVKDRNYSYCIPIPLRKNPSKPTRFAWKDLKGKASLELFQKGTSRCPFKVQIRDEVFFLDNKLTVSLVSGNLDVSAEIQTIPLPNGKRFKLGKNRMIEPKLFILKGKMKALPDRPGKFSFSGFWEINLVGRPQQIDAHIELAREIDPTNVQLEIRETVTLERQQGKNIYQYRSKQGPVNKLYFDVETGNLRVSGSSPLMLDYPNLVLGLRVGEFFSRVEVQMSGRQGSFKY